MVQPSIFAATDLSERSAHVAGRGAQLAQCLGARLVLAHVGEDSSARFSLGRAKQSRADMLADLAREYGAETRLLSGEPHVVLPAAARADNAALIILGLHQERRVLDLLRLTTMEHIVMAAPSPVLIAHQPPTRGYGQVLLASDFSQASAESLIMAARIAPTARFHAVHALQLPLGALFHRGHDDSEAALAEAIEERRAFMQTADLPALTEPLEIVPGGVHQVLKFRREELAADLVCIGAQSGSTPDDLGEYARDLMRAPPTDLLVARAPQAPAKDA
ncbi:universal stress protein [Pararhodobacter oceanensis]|uniref:universal stress protein n=1 Tax=Pararhodobacter oceanensis TaxID=2172121 RepID=UPI003A924551